MAERVAKTVLLVCQANTARSVMAQAYLARLLAARGLDGGVSVVSGGVAPWARDGMLASLDARLALKADGIAVDETASVSTALREHPELVAAADMVVTMTVAQKIALDGAARGRVYTLRELAGEAGDIADPAGQGEAAFVASRDEIKRCLAKALDRLLGVLGA